MEERKFNLKRFLHEICTEPGAVNFFDGHMGKGKTHAAIALAQTYIESGQTPAYLLTNVPFEKRISERERGLGYPDRVYKVRSMDDLFRAVTDIMTKHPDGDYRIIWVLDEAQNFMRAESHMTPLTNFLHSFFSNIRKLNMSVWLLTPLPDNLGPRMRTGPVTGDRDGYVTVTWEKDMEAITAFLDKNGVDRKNAIRFMVVKWKVSMQPFIMFVPSTSWTTPLTELAVGESAYDTKALASFSMGSVSIDDIMGVLSADTSREVAGALRAYYKKKDEAPKEEIENDPDAKLMERVGRGRAAGMTWKQIAAYEDIKDSTIKSKFYTFSNKKVSSKIKTASKKTNDEDEALHARRESEREDITEGGTRTPSSAPPSAAIEEGGEA